MNIAENIRKLRKENSMTQEQLAEALDVTVGAVYKWESRQALPEIKLLIKMADLFKVSIDSLLGYKIVENRLDQILLNLDQAIEQADTVKMEDLCKQLLHDYPNHSSAIQKCARGYEILYLLTSNPSYMEVCIEQTKRLFLLNKGEPDIKRIERIKDLANHHANLEKWDQAKSYYEESNFDKHNNASIANCLLKMNKNEEALSLVSEYIVDSVYGQFFAICTLADIWNKMGEEENAKLAYEWMSDVMKKLSYSSILTKILDLRISNIHHSKEEITSEIQAEYAKEKFIQPKVPFLRLEKKKTIIVVVSDQEKASLKDKNKDTFTCDLRGE